MFQIYNFTTGSGRQPVDEFINNLETETQAKIDEVIGYFRKHGFHLETKYLRRMTGSKKLWELRIMHQANHYRIFVAKIAPKAIVMLHAINKKTAKTPVKDIRTALKRLDHLESNLI